MRDKELTTEDKRQFAKNQLKLLKNYGIRGGLRLSRIFKASGPGQIPGALSLVKQGTEGVRKDLLDCILTGVSGSQAFGKARMAATLEAAGFDVPETSSSHTFFRMLDGALEILVPNAYEFTDKELDEIKEGLNKRNA